jgi:hypothetical protein
MTLPNDDELRARFAELRAFDSQFRPELDAVVARGEQRAARTRPRRALAPIWIAAAAGVVLAAGVVGLAWRARKLSQLPRQPVAQSIISWRSPTAWLLRTPGRELYAPPSILTSIIDGATRAPAQRKGDGS